MKSFIINVAILALFVLGSLAQNYKKDASQHVQAVKRENSHTTSLSIAEALARQSEINRANFNKKAARYGSINYALFDYQYLTKVGEVLPTLGASAVNVAYYDANNKFDSLFVLSGGLNAVPENWISGFSGKVASWVKTHGTSDAYTYAYAAQYDKGNDRVVPVGFTNEPLIEGGRNGPLPSLNHKRAFHVSTSFLDADSNAGLFVWGGSESSSVEIFNYAANKASEWVWEEVATSDAPEPRYGASVASFSDKIFIFGGITADGQTPEEILMFDATLRTWERISPATSPSGRYGASWNFIFEDNIIVLFGGADANGNVLGDTWVYNIMTSSWMEVTPAEGDPTPSARVFHGAQTALAFTDGTFAMTIQVFLGEGPQVDINIVFIFDVSTYQWKFLINGNNAARPNFQAGFAYASALESAFTAVFSGVRQENALEASVWTFEAVDPDPDNNAPNNWYRGLCYPTFQWNSKQFTCLAEAEEECAECYDYSDVQSVYVKGLKTKARKGDDSGVLRQCPAEWRQEYPEA